MRDACHSPRSQQRLQPQQKTRPSYRFVRPFQWRHPTLHSLSCQQRLVRCPKRPPSSSRCLSCLPRLCARALQAYQTVPCPPARLPSLHPSFQSRFAHHRHLPPPKEPCFYPLASCSHPFPHHLTFWRRVSTAILTLQGALSPRQPLCLRCLYLVRGLRSAKLIPTLAFGEPTQAGEDSCARGHLVSHFVLFLLSSAGLATARLHRHSESERFSPSPLLAPSPASAHGVL